MSDRTDLGQLQWVEFKNANAGQVPAFGVVRSTGISAVSDGRVVLTVDQPNTYGCQDQCLINGPVSVNAGNYGLCTRDGILTALYDDADGTPAFGELWGPRSGTWKLKKNTGGFRVLGVANSTAKIALVIPEPFLDFRATADADITADSTGTVSIFYRSASGTFTDTTVNATALNDLDGTVKSGATCRCRFQPYVSGGTYTEGWVIYQADCS